MNKITCLKRQWINIYQHFATKMYLCPGHRRNILVSPIYSITSRHESVTIGTKKNQYRTKLLKPFLTENYFKKNNTDFSAIKSACEEYGYSRSAVWHNYCMIYYLDHKEVKNGIALIEYITKQELSNPSLMIKAMFISLLGESGHQYHDLLYKTYEDLSKASGVLPRSILRYLINGYSKTPKWKKCLDFIEMSKMDTKLVSPHMVYKFIHRAVEEEDMVLADKILHDLTHDTIRYSYSTQGFFQNLVLLAMNKKGNFIIAFLLYVMKTKRVYPDKKTATELRRYFETCIDEHWTCKWTHIHHSGVCNTCGTILPEVEFTQNEFEELKREIYEKLLVQSNIYLNTQPQELENFDRYLTKHGPFDVIIDGLNVGLGKSIIKSESLKLRLAVEAFLKLDKKVLVLGKNHIYKWTPRDHINFIADKSYLFFLDDVSSDDPFVLYAACQSGSKTLILSKDTLTNHLIRLNNNQQITYTKWLRARLISTYYFKPNLNYEDPMNYVAEPISVNNTIHIPYLHNNDIHWLCALCNSNSPHGVNSLMNIFKRLQINNSLKD